MCFGRLRCRWRVSSLRASSAPKDGARGSVGTIRVRVSGKPESAYTRFEMVIKPFSDAHIIEVASKGTIRNRETLKRNHYQFLTEADVDSLQEHYRPVGSGIRRRVCESLMFDHHATLKRTLDERLVAILRTPTADPLMPAMKAINAGGINVIEITMTVPGALRAIEQAREEFGDSIVLGAGSVLDAETARACMLAGAEFIVSPVVRRDVIDVCKRYGAVVMPGAMTPTEVLDAWEAGADVVKVFPANVVGGPAFIKALKGPLPQVRLLPTGGVNHGHDCRLLRCRSVCGRDGKLLAVF